MLTDTSLEGFLVTSTNNKDMLEANHSLFYTSVCASNCKSYNKISKLKGLIAS